MLRWGRKGIAQTTWPLAHFAGTLKDPLSEESAQGWLTDAIKLTCRVWFLPVPPQQVRQRVGLGEGF